MAVIFHVDMDAFYASVEQNDHPEYRGKPVIIGARPGTRGVVSACSYEAREFGVHSAMPISRAYRLCPKGVYLPVRMVRYGEVSARIMELFGDFTPVVRQISVDEAFLDMTGTRRLFGDPEEAARAIKERIRGETGCALSIGIASNHYVAKMASDYGKPDGLYRVEEGREEEFLDKLKLEDLWGVGGKTLERLEELNITTVPRLREFSQGILESMLGKAAGAYLYAAARGRNPGVFIEEPKSRSISNEITFPEDTRDSDAVERVLLELSHQVMFRMMKEGARAKTVFLKVRFDDFSTTTAQTTLRHAVSSAEEIYSLVKELLDKRWNRSRLVRLIGIGVSSVEGSAEPEQPELFEDRYDRKKRVEKTVLELRRKLPDESIVKASLLRRDNKRGRAESTE
jgi:DNA polymerase IV